MYIFIDESNIHKPVGHSTFVLAYVEVDDNSSLEKTVLDVETSLGIDGFHWAKAAWPVKEKFLQAIVKESFTIKLAVIKNPINPKTELERILPHLIIEKHIHGIYIDGKKPKWYAKKIKKILRDKGVSARKVRTVSDTQYPGVRVADTMAGIMRWWYDQKSIEKITPYYNKIKEKIVIIIE